MLRRIGGRVFSKWIIGASFLAVLGVGYFAYQNYASSGKVVKFSGATFPRHNPNASDAEISREYYLSIMRDQAATSLSRETFQRTADGKVVNWLVRLEDLSSPYQDGASGEFSIVYQKPGRESESTATFSARFSSVDESLLSLRRGDWVKLTGTLKFESSTARLVSASVEAVKN